MAKHYVTISLDQAELDSIVFVIKRALDTNPPAHVVKPLTSALLTVRAGAVRAGWNSESA